MLTLQEVPQRAWQFEACKKWDWLTDKRHRRLILNLIADGETRIIEEGKGRWTLYGDIEAVLVQDIPDGPTLWALETLVAICKLLRKDSM